MQLRLYLTALFAYATPLAFSAPAPQARAIPPDGTVPASVVQDSALLTAGPVSVLSTAEVNSYIPYEWFAQATYCPQPSQANWSCSEFCLPPFFHYTIDLSVHRVVPS
jgi:hypothetical protein